MNYTFYRKDGYVRAQNKIEQSIVM